MRATNANERQFRQVRRRTRPMGTFQDRTSMDRVFFAVFMHQNKGQGTATPFSLTLERYSYSRSRLQPRYFGYILPSKKTHRITAQTGRYGVRSLRSQGRLARPCAFGRYGMLGDDPTHHPRHRVQVFVDFWNYTLSMRAADEAFRTGWSRLGQVLSRAAVTVIDPAATGEYQGLNFYGSHDPDPDADRKLYHWATQSSAGFQGCACSSFLAKKR